MEILNNIKKYTSKLEFLKDTSKKNKLLIILNLFLYLLTNIITLVILFYYIDNMWPVFSFIVLVLYFIISSYALINFIKLISTTQKLQTATNYNITLQKSYDNVKCFKHDFDNIISSIGGYIKTEDIEGLKKYYSDLSDDCQKVNNLYVLNPNIINNNGIYNLLTQKYYEADNKNIKVNITFLLDLNKLNMKIYEFTRILGILLDNAIEASEKCSKKIINLDFKDDNRNSRQLIRIENTYDNKTIDVDKIFEKGISNKENHTGLGLWEIRKIIAKNNNINLYTSKNDKYFIQQLEIYY